MALAFSNSDISTELWQSALGALEQRFSKPIFEMWIKPMRFVSLSGTELTLAVQSNFARDWVENRLKPQIRDVLTEVLGAELDLHFTVAADQPEAASAAPPAEPPPRPPDEYRPGNLNSRYTFEEFVVGNSNRFAHAAAQAVAVTPARAYNPLFIYGGVGLGKTHLMHAIGHRVMQENPSANIVYVSSEKFTNEFIIAIKNNQTPEFRNKYRHVDVLLIDDIQFLEGKEQTQEEFFHTFNSLHESGRQLVISSDRPPKEIQTLENRLRSRFEWGLLTDIQSPDLETREAILRKKAESEKVPVPNEVTTFIARVIPSNIRELEGALIRVVAFASLTKSQITVELATEVLKNAVAQAPLRRVTINLIKERVARAHGLTVKEMDYQRRDQRLAAPRQIAMYLARELTDFSLPQIAREFGKKDHTTVMYACNKVKDQMQRDEAYRNKVGSLLALCQNE
ncbi:MAG: chromosomal replication initiator protein DnaA [Candidatus Eremiobacteraeota bacterium]|nr:chromosomal replication initiator protein DnaA [Candidatus Eremiobacteraeota bacterium]MBV9277733.1 chromosomal replication initiator protein DnaA [Candidatus Eremiobacteraeota bacterium]